AVDLDHLRLHVALRVRLPRLLRQRARPPAVAVRLPERTRQREPRLGAPRRIHFVRLADLVRSLQRRQRAARVVLGEVAEADARQRVREAAIVQAQLALPDHARALERLPRLAPPPQPVQDLAAVVLLRRQLGMTGPEPVLDQRDGAVGVRQRFLVALEALQLDGDVALGDADVRVVVAQRLLL